MNKFSIVIPILNEEKNIKRLINRIKLYVKNIKFEIIFVDDNSNDNSLLVLKKIKSKNKNIRFFIRKNQYRDLSQSCILGFNKAKYENIIVMDGDLQHDPKHIPKLINKYLSENLDLVVGARNFSNFSIKGLSFTRFWASKILILFFFILIGKKTIDPMSGFFIFKKKNYKKYKNKLFSKGYKILSDLLYSPEKNFKTKDVIIDFRNRDFGKSKMNYKVLFNIINFIFFIFIKKFF